MALFYQGGVLGSPVSGAAAKGVLFVDASGNLAQDSRLSWDKTTHRLLVNTELDLGVPITIGGDDTTGNIMQWLFGTKGVLMSCNGFSPTNLTVPFHVNLGGTTKSFAVKEDDVGRSASDHQFQVIGSKTSRTVAQVKITQGPTPTATGHALLIENNAAQTQFVINADGKILAAPAGSALPAAFGAINIKESAGGYGIMINDITHLNKNLLNPINLGAAFQMDAGGSTTGWSFKQDGVEKFFLAREGYFEFIEQSDPAAPATNKGRLYARDNGSGKTQLVIRFPTGAIQVLATEP